MLHQKIHPFNRYGCHGNIVITYHAAKSRWLYITHTKKTQNKTHIHNHRQKHTRRPWGTWMGMCFWLLIGQRKPHLEQIPSFVCVTNRKRGTNHVSSYDYILILPWFELVLHVWVGWTCPIYLPGTCKSTWTDHFYQIYSFSWIWDGWTVPLITPKNTSCVLKYWNIKC